MKRTEYMIYYPISLSNNFWLCENGKSRNIPIWVNDIRKAIKSFNSLVENGFKQVRIEKHDLTKGISKTILESIER